MGLQSGMSVFDRSPIGLRWVSDGNNMLVNSLNYLITNDSMYMIERWPRFQPDYGPRNSKLELRLGFIQFRPFLKSLKKFLLVFCIQCTLHNMMITLFDISIPNLFKVLRF